MRTIERYDSLDPSRLLDVTFEISDKPEYIRSFRTSYASIWELIERVGYNDLKRERYINRERVR